MLLTDALVMLLARGRGLAVVARSCVAMQHAGGGGGPSEAFRTGPGSDRLLLASHNRLLWYYYNSGKVDVLHEGQVRVCSKAYSGSRAYFGEHRRRASLLLSKWLLDSCPAFSCLCCRFVSVHYRQCRMQASEQCILTRHPARVSFCPAGRLLWRLSRRSAGRRRRAEHGMGGVAATQLEAEDYCGAIA